MVDAANISAHPSGIGLSVRQMTENAKEAPSDRQSAAICCAAAWSTHGSTEPQHSPSLTTWVVPDKAQTPTLLVVVTAEVVSLAVDVSDSELDASPHDATNRTAIAMIRFIVLSTSQTGPDGNEFQVAAWCPLRADAAGACATYGDRADVYRDTRIELKVDGIAEDR